MQFVKDNRRYCQFALGVIGFGLGQRLLTIFILKPLSEDKPIHLLLGVLGVLLFMIGSVFLVKLFMWMYQHYNQQQRVLKVLGTGLLATFSVGIMIGMIGQFVYESTTVSYEHIKLAIWLVSLFCQLCIRLFMVRLLASFYRQEPFTWRHKDVVWLVGIAISVTVVVALMSTVSYIVADIALYVLDSFVILGTSYYVIKK